jgi:hypothetical protein
VVRLIVPEIGPSLAALVPRRLNYAAQDIIATGVIPAYYTCRPETGNLGNGVRQESAQSTSALHRRTDDIRLDSGLVRRRSGGPKCPF